MKIETWPICEKCGERLQVDFENKSEDNWTCPNGHNPPKFLRVEWDDQRELPIYDYECDDV
jgi:hypothetical protein